ncbi:hypothetical protein DH2020_036102 [Rehmannia glutinosa]|uniref:Fatty acid hydroxylase domain-containing protein n=1 Tax=Rehmannia glutinosa TaxID=99300 RepID=A0ABR0V771_REHGL
MLPYATVEAAETALGRSLTAAETLWLNYSAHKSDYFLYCHNIIFLFLIFSVFPFTTSLSRTFLQEICWALQNPTQSEPLVFRHPPLLQICDAHVLPRRGPPPARLLPFHKGIRTSLPLPPLWEVAAQLGVYFIVEDYGNYWVHRFLHCKWGYEKIHKVHHEYTAPIGFAAPYAHWAEILILGIPSFLGPAMVPGHMITFWLWIALRQIEAIETHSGKFVAYTLHVSSAAMLVKPSQEVVVTLSSLSIIQGYRYQKKVLQQLRDGMKSNQEHNGVLHDISAQGHKVD